MSILTEGCRDSLVLWDNKLIDGHNRYEICTKNNIPFGVTNKSFDSRDDVSIWMIKNQFGRRNLVPYVRAELALKLEVLFQKKALENNVTKSHSFKNLSNNEPLPCQNSDNPIDNIKENSMIDNQEDEDHKEELPRPQPKNNYERAKEALKLEETFYK